MDITTGSTARIHNQNNQDAIQVSLAELGAGRSIALDADNIIFAGNEVYRQAQKLGIKVRIIDTDGSELIAVRRQDVKNTDAKRNALAIADNRCSDLSMFDDNELTQLLAQCEYMCDASGFTDTDLEELKNYNSILDDLTSENTFANSVRASSDVFSITFVFSKTKGACVTEFIKLKDKNTLTEHIIQYCNKEMEASHA